MQNISILKLKFNFLFLPISISIGVNFRIIFGLLMLISSIRFWSMGWIEEQYLNPAFHFKYFGFEWLEVLPEKYLYCLYALMVLTLLGIITGFLYRISTVLYFLIFTYFELIDLTYYLNHYYLVSLLSFLLIFAPFGKAFSLDNLFFKRKEYTNIEFYWIFIFQFQIALVYIYAGIAKMNSIWLFEAMPLKIWLQSASSIPYLGGFFQNETIAYLFSWAGMIFDLSIIFLLLNNKLRFISYLVLLLFHAFTGYLFQIGMFPLLMSGLVLIFFGESFHNQILLFLKTTFRNQIKCNSTEISNILYRNKSVLFFTFISIYIFFQVVFPFRYLLYKNDFFYSEQGYRFGWRVMLFEKSADAIFYVTNTQTGKKQPVINSDFLNPHQEKQMSMQPDMILQFAHFLAKNYSISGIEPNITAEVRVMLNGKPSIFLFNPDLVLNKIEDSFKEKTWLNFVK